MNDKSFFSKLETQVKASCQIDNELFEEFDVKRGLEKQGWNRRSGRTDQYR